MCRANQICFHSFARFYLVIGQSVLDQIGESLLVSCVYESTVIAIWASQERRPPSWHGVGSEDHLPLHAKRACVWYWSGKKVAWVDGSDISKLSLSIFFFLSFTLGGPFLMRPGAFWWSALVVISVQKLRPRIVSLWCQKIPPSSPPTTEEENGRGGAHTHATKRESTRKKIRRQRTRGRETRYNNEKGGKKISRSPKKRAHHRGRSPLMDLENIPT